MEAEDGRQEPDDETPAPTDITGDEGEEFATTSDSLPERVVAQVMSSINMSQFDTPATTTLSSSEDLTADDEPVPYEFKMWQITGGEQVEVQWGEASFKGSSFVLDGRDAVLVVHGFGSGERDAAAEVADAHASAIGAAEHSTPPVQVVELGEQQDSCTAFAEATPRLDCPKVATTTDAPASRLDIRPHAESAPSKLEPAPSTVEYEPRGRKPAYKAKIWKIEKIGSKKPKVEEISWGAHSFKKYSFVLDGRDKVLIVHGHDSSSFQRYAAQTKAHAIRGGKRNGQKVAIETLELPGDKDQCSAEAGDTPEVKC